VRERGYNKEVKIKWLKRKDIRKREYRAKKLYLFTFA